MSTVAVPQQQQLQQQQQQYQQPPLVKLPYTILSCTSSDDGYNVSQLEQQATHTKGWQSSRFPIYPQCLILQFATLYDIRKIQILSHQSKIASTIEVYIGRTAADNDSNNNNNQLDIDNIIFQRLGYLSLDSNERSQFKARELKSVYVNARGGFLKLVIKRCHKNPINMFDQVGIIAINVVGNKPIPGSIDPNNTPASLLYNNNNNPMNSNRSQQQQPPNTAIPADLQQYEFDSSTTAKLRELSRRKRDAIAAEDYDEAKQIKLVIDNIKRVAADLSGLERNKRQAIEAEDFDTAKQLKKQIDSIRQKALGSLAAQSTAPGNSNNNNYYDDQRQLKASNSNSNIGISSRSTEYINEDDRPLHGKVSGSAAADMYLDAEAAAAYGEDDIPASVHSRAAELQLPTHLEDSEEPSASGYSDPSGDDRPIQGVGMKKKIKSKGKSKGTVIASIQEPTEYPTSDGDDRPLKPAKKANKQMQGSGSAASLAPTTNNNNNEYPDDSTGAVDDSQLTNSSYPNDEFQRESVSNERQLNVGHGNRTRYTAADEFQSPDAADSNELPPPENLSASNRKDAEPLIELFTENPVKCLYSKNWQLRVSGLKTINEQLINNQLNQFESRLLWQSICRILKKSLADKVAGVFLSSTVLLESLINNLSQSIKSDEVRSSLESIIGLMTDKLGASNSRERESATHILLLLLTIQPGSIPPHLLSPLKKKEEFNPLPLKGRAKLLLKSILKFGLNDSFGLSLTPIMNFITPHLEPRDASVRDSMFNVAAGLVQLVGRQRLEPYLKELRGSIVESLDLRFEDIAQGRVAFTPPEGSAIAASQSSAGNGNGGGSLNNSPEHKRMSIKDSAGTAAAVGAAQSKAKKSNIKQTAAAPVPAAVQEQHQQPAPAANKPARSKKAAQVPSQPVAQHDQQPTLGSSQSQSKIPQSKNTSSPAQTAAPKQAKQAQEKKQSKQQQQQQQAQPQQRQPTAKQPTPRPIPALPANLDSSEQFDVHGAEDSSAVIQGGELSTQRLNTQGSTTSQAVPSADPYSDADTEDSYSDLQGKCQFCLLEDPTFTDEKLDLHYWQDCPMLIQCQYCEQVIEIPTLNDHLINECESQQKHAQCKKCLEGILESELQAHTIANKCKRALPATVSNRCALCHEDIGKGEEGWKQHLLTQGCPNNNRTRNG